jgi:hypothetical protein
VHQVRRRLRREPESVTAETRCHEAILARLDELEAFEAPWYKFQSDVCCCDEEDNAE